MLFMNDFEIAQAEQTYRDHPILGPATETLSNLREWADLNSDGWHSWPKPARAAKQLMTLVQEQQRTDRAHRESHVTRADVQRALRPIKAFRTRQGADFVIVEPDVPPPALRPSIYGACGVMDCRDCRPYFDANNNVIPGTD